MSLLIGNVTRMFMKDAVPPLTNSSVVPLSCSSLARIVIENVTITYQAFAERLDTTTLQTIVQERQDVRVNYYSKLSRTPGPTPGLLYFIVLLFFGTRPVSRVEALAVERANTNLRSSEHHESGCLELGKICCSHQSEKLYS